MGFSLHFMRVTKDVQLDVDRAAVAAFLDQHGLRVVESPYGGEIVDRDDRALTIDGAFSDLHLDSLEQSDPLSGGIFHATLSPAECAFVYDLCAAAGFRSSTLRVTRRFSFPSAITSPTTFPSWRTSSGSTAPRNWRGRSPVVSKRSASFGTA